jgi:hypothetical protein
MALAMVGAAAKVVGWRKREQSEKACGVHAPSAGELIVIRHQQVSEVTVNGRWETCCAYRPQCNRETALGER